MKKYFLLCFAIIMTTCPASAQLLSIGALGGVPFFDQTTTKPDESRPYIVGPSVELRVPGGFAIEADALYQRLGSTSQFSFIGAGLNGPSLLAYFTVRQRANSWEFPVLGKYYFRRRESGWQPFLGTGWSFRTAGEHQSVSQLTADSSGALHASSFQNSFRADLAVGATFAAGIQVRAGRFALTPEVRYTRWGTSDGSFRKNEAGFLLGIRF